MDRVFPLGLPIATQTYLVLYVVTLVVHLLLVSYVVAGSLWLVVDRTLGGQSVERRSGGLISAMVGDWLPFALGLAITAGVAPLLFIQILYKQSFYTANLLLFHRWMLILPVLMVGFYLLYVGKTPRMQGWPRSVQLAVRLVTLGCFLFIGWSWVENHLLSLDREVWPAFYASTQLFYANSLTLPRCAAWLGVSFPTMAMLLSWQLRERAGRERFEVAPEARRLAAVALCGLVLAALCLAWYRAELEPAAAASLRQPIAGPYVWIVAVAAVVQGAGWLTVAVSRKLFRSVLAVITLGAVGFVAGICVLREVLRLATKDLVVLTDLHERAAHIGGLGVFLVFFVLNVALITYCVVLVRRAIRARASIS